MIMSHNVIQCVINIIRLYLILANTIVRMHDAIIIIMMASYISFIVTGAASPPSASTIAVVLPSPGQNNTTEL